MNRLLKLWRAERGAAIIELAFVAPVIALMTVGVVDMSNGFSAKLRLEQAAQRSIEKVMQTTGVTSVETTIANEAICQFNGTSADGSCNAAPLTGANVTVTHLLYCREEGEGEPAEDDLEGDGDCDEDEIESRWIRVSMWTEYEPLFPRRFSGIDEGGVYRIEASAGIRTE